MGRGHDSRHVGAEERTERGLGCVRAWPGRREGFSGVWVCVGEWWGVVGREGEREGGCVVAMMGMRTVGYEGF